MELITSSRIRAVDACRRLDHWQYREGVRPFTEAEPLRVGTAVHVALEAWLKSMQAGHEFPARWLEAAFKALEEHEPPKDDFEAARIAEMIYGYHERWHNDPFEVVAVELEFIAPLLNPDTRGSSKTFKIAGKIDGIIRLPDGRLMILEHKTAGQDVTDPSLNYWTKLAMDSQVSMYYLGALSLGYEVDGCLYDVLRKPGQKPLKATPPDLRKYKKKCGTLYANQREHDETPDQYSARIAAAMHEDLDAYFVRKEVQRSEAQLLEFMYDAWSKAGQIRELNLAFKKHGLKAVPRSPSACHMYNRECSFWDCCAAGIDPDDHPDRFKRLDFVHPELTRA